MKHPDGDTILKFALQLLDETESLDYQGASHRLQAMQ